MKLRTIEYNECFRIPVDKVAVECVVPNSWGPVVRALALP